MISGNGQQETFPGAIVPPTVDFNPKRNAHYRRRHSSQGEGNPNTSVLINGWREGEEEKERKGKGKEILQASIRTKKGNVTAVIAVVDDDDELVKQLVSQLIGVLSPVKHQGLYQG